MKEKIYKKIKILGDLFKLFARDITWSLLFSLFIAAIFLGIRQMMVMKSGETAYQELSSQGENLLNQIDNDNSYCDFFLSKFADKDAFLSNFDDYDLNSIYVESACVIASGIINEDKNLMYSSTERLYLEIENVIYSCEIYEVPELYQAYQEMKSQNHSHSGYFNALEATSVFIDTEHQKFIPYEIKVKAPDDSILPQTASMALNVPPHENYRLITADNSTFNMLLIGTNTTDFYALFNTSSLGKVEDLDQFSISTEYTDVVKNGNSVKSKIYTRLFPIVGENGEKNYFFTILEVELDIKFIIRAWLILSFIIFLLCFLIEILPKIANQIAEEMAEERAKKIAEEQFKNLQKKLIKQLAHDIKTPLTRISFSAENLLVIYQMGEQEQQYLKKIMENVNHIDEIINGTLELNKVPDIHSLDKDDISSLNDFTQQFLISKYPDAEITIEGDAHIRANPTALSRSIDNLVTNAIKYVSPGGTIIIKIDQKAFKIRNDISRKIDTTNLLKSFNDKSSSGLGLSIADNMAQANGFRLQISCDDQHFIASILF